MKVIMPYVTWRAAGESNRKKKPGGMHGFELGYKLLDLFIAEVKGLSYQIATLLFTAEVNKPYNFLQESLSKR